jgi:hypothetical protein
MKISQEEFLEKLWNKNEHYRNGEFEVISFDTSPFVIVSTKYGNCKPRKTDLLRGNAPTIKSAIDKNSFCIKELKNIRGERYDYSLVNYISAKTPLEIICDRHGIFNQSFDTHKKGHNCPYCAKEDRTYNKDYIVEYLNNNNFDNSKIKVLTNRGIKSKLEITCSIGHTYESDFSRRRNKDGCRECHRAYLYISNNNITEDTYLVPMTFYILELEDEKRSIFKVGITKNIKDRIKDIKSKSKYKVTVLMKVDTNLYEAYKMEQYFLELYKPFKAKNLIAFGGHTECFIENPLNYEYYYK